jgi:hypothetical protein
VGFAGVPNLRKDIVLNAPIDQKFSGESLGTCVQSIVLDQLAQVTNGVDPSFQEV